jgi:hypothetical protein
MQAMYTGRIYLRQAACQEIGLLLIVALKADAISRLNYIFEQGSHTICRNNLFPANVRRTLQTRPAVL